MIITGAASGNGATVDNNNRLHTEAVSRDLLVEACLAGNAFNFNTGDVTLTSGNESAIGYFEYLGDSPFVITEILVIVGAATGTLSSDGVAKIYRNPTGGTIVSGATPIEVAANRNFSSSKSATGNMYKGAEGNTITGGTVFATTTRGSSFSGVVAFDAAAIVIEKGNTLCVSWEPPTGNTSQIVKIAATGYILSSDITGE